MTPLMTRCGYRVFARIVVTARKALLLSLLMLGGCGPGPNILTILEERYWRPEDRVCPDADQSCADGKWKTNWQVWFKTEEECLAAIDETQRCRQTRM